MKDVFSNPPCLRLWCKRFFKTKGTVIKMKRKLIKALAAFAAAAGVLCGCGKADPNINFYEYEDIISETGETVGVKITACSLAAEEIRVPETLDGKKVLCIGMKMISEGNYIGTFEGCSSEIKRIILPEGLEEIEGTVFTDSVSLQSIYLPESLEKMSGSVFAYCEGLTSVTVPENIKELRGSDFLGCKSLETVELPEGITYIGQMAFAKCESLEKLTLPSSLAEIDLYAFSGCTALSEISLPDGLLSIGGMAFDGCEGLTDVTVPDTVEKIERDAFNGCFNITVHYRGMDYEYSRLYDIYTLEEGDELPEWFIPGEETGEAY